jgi:hypothetical protein
MAECYHIEFKRRMDIQESREIKSITWSDDQVKDSSSVQA